MNWMDRMGQRTAGVVAVFTTVVILSGCRFWADGPDEPPVTEDPRVSHVDVKITLQRKKKLVGEPGIWTVKEDEALGPADRFRLTIEPDADGWVYVFMVGPEGEVTVLFPASEFRRRYRREFDREFPERENYCRAGWEYEIPGMDEDGKLWYFVPRGPAGERTLYVVAGQEELEDLEAFVGILERTSGPAERKGRLEERFDYVRQLTLRRKANDGDLP